jgi:hypothetical protein
MIARFKEDNERVRYFKPDGTAGKLVEAELVRRSGLSQTRQSCSPVTNGFRGFCGKQKGQKVTKRAKSEIRTKQISFSNSRRQPEDEQRMSCRDRDVLFAVDRKADRIGDDRAPGLEIPQRFSAQRVQRIEIPFIRAAEDQPARRRHHSGPRW